MKPSRQPHSTENGHRSTFRPTKASRNQNAANTSAKRGRMTLDQPSQLPAIHQLPWDKQPSTTVVEITTPSELMTDTCWTAQHLSPTWQQSSPGVMNRLAHHVPTPAQGSVTDVERRNSLVDQRSFAQRAVPQPEALYAPFSPLGASSGSEEDTIGDEFPSSRSSTASPVTVPERVKTTLYTALGAGRLDPFQVYCKKDLPLYIHEVLDHYLHHVCCSFTLVADGVGQSVVLSHIMGHAMGDILTWYTIILAGVTHYLYVHGDRHLSPEFGMLRLSYKTQAMALVREQLAQDPNNVSENTLFAINTLAVHGGALFERGFQRDRLGDAKTFARANNVNYYSSIAIEWEHWHMFTKLIRKRGGPTTLSRPEGLPGFPPSPGPGCLTTSDIMIAWRHLKCPEFSLLISTDQVINMPGIQNDQEGISLSQKLLSGFPAMPKSNMHFKRLAIFLKHVRKLLVDFEQFQRGAAPRLDIRKLYWTRMMLMHDLLLLPDLEMSDNPLDLLYELVRNCSLAFMQVVLCPVVASNHMPEKILKQLIPVLKRSTEAIHGRTLDREHPSLFLWAVLLAGMLAMEHYQTRNDSVLLDEVSAFIDRIPIKAEKASWSMAVRVAQTFLWLESDCEPPGRRYWNYACLWLAERQRSAAIAQAVT
jgi:hypothetical protein